jgi:hypothetical protein
MKKLIKTVYYYDDGTFEEFHALSGGPQYSFQNQNIFPILKPAPNAVQTDKNETQHGDT